MVSVENEQEAREYAMALATGRDMTGAMQRQVSQPKSRPVPRPKWTDEWTIIDITEIE